MRFVYTVAMVDLWAFADELEKTGADGEETPSLLRRALPAALGLAAGAGAYKYLRKVRFSKDPGVRKMQEAAKGRLTHVEALDPGEKKPGALGRFYTKHVRGVDDVIYEPRRKVHAREQMTSAQLDKIQPQKIEGAVQTFGEPHQARAFRGDFNVTPDPGLAQRLGENKLFEAKILRKIQGGAPRSDSMIKYIAPGSKATPEMMDQIQANLKKKYPNGYVIKPINDAASGGVPTHKSNFREILTSKTDSAHKGWMREMVDDPKEYMVQEYIPINKTRRAISIPSATDGQDRRTQIMKMVDDEWRVHVVDGRVVPGSTHHRWALGTVRSEIEGVDAFMQKVLDKMPAKARKAPMGVDVVRDVHGNYRIMELNGGGQSGFLLPHIPDPTSRKHKAARNYYRHVTGRASKSDAAARALGAAGTVGGAATATEHLTRRKSETEPERG